MKYNEEAKGAVSERSGAHVDGLRCKVKEALMIDGLGKVNVVAVGDEFKSLMESRSNARCVR